MKKLLSFLGIITMTVTPVVTVIACTEVDNNNENEDNDLVIESGDLRLDAEDILGVILKNGNDIIDGGKPKETLQKFIKVFSYGFASQLATPEEDGSHPFKAKLEAKIAEKNSGYVNDQILDSIIKDFNSFKNTAERNWERDRRNAEDEFGNDWEVKYRDRLRKQFDKNYSSWSDFKDEYIFNQAVRNTSIDSPLNALNKEINTDFAKGTGFLKPDAALVQFRSNVIYQTNRFGTQTVDFQSNSKTLNASEKDDAAKRAASWYGQFDNWINGINELKTSNEEQYNLVVGDLINLINATGGLELEQFIEDHQGDTRPIMLIDDVTWANKENIDQVFGAVPEWSDKLLKRTDSRFEEHFGANITSGEQIIGGTTNLDNGGRIETLNQSYGKLLEAIPNVIVSDVTIGDSQVNGLYSNSQRYLTNQFYNKKKPVAITEIVVKPWGDESVKLKDEVNTKPFISGANDKYIGLYNFIDVFVNNGISGGNGALRDHTKEMFDGQSNYSWDLLVNNKGKLNEVNGVNEENGEWRPGNIWRGLESNLSLSSNSGRLLTIDSQGTFDNTLKYSVYDFLNNPTKAEYSSWSTDYREDAKYINDFDYSTLIPDKQAPAKSIAGLIHSLDRSGKANAGDNEKTEDNVYQVLNAEQGIIAFMGDDGIHFVRIEAYPLMKTVQLTEQTPVSSANTDQAMLKTFASHYQFEENARRNNDARLINDEVAITTDYQNRNEVAQQNTKVKYEDFNRSFGNKYLEFLANASLINSGGFTGNLSAKYQFDLKNEVNSWANANSANDSHNWIAIWDYLKEIFGYETDAELYDEIFIFELNSKSDANSDLSKELNKRYRNLILDNLKSNRNLISANPIVQLANQWTNYEKSFEKRTDNHELVVYTPWNYINSGDDLSKILSLDELANWDFDNQQTVRNVRYLINENNYWNFESTNYYLGTRIKEEN